MAKELKEKQHVKGGKDNEQGRNDGAEYCGD